MLHIFKVPCTRFDEITSMA